jgi:ribosomal-protein-alanine N-acetyltransferase
MVFRNFDPFPNLETERLYLRRIAYEDVDEIFALRSNVELMKYIPKPLVKTTAEALAHIEIIDENIDTQESINWAITLKGNPKLIGIIGHYRMQTEHFRAEIGYMLLPEYHGRGIITEAIKVVLNYGFDIMKLHSIEAIIDPDNFASERALQKSGFVKEAHFKENEYYNGRFLDTAIYCILNRH